MFASVTRFLRSLTRGESRRRTRRTRRRRTSFRSHGSAVVELLEDRTLLSLSLGDVNTLLSGHTVTGATIVTHGFQFTNDTGDSLMSLAETIEDRVETEHGADSAWVLDHDILGGDSVFQVPASGVSNGELVLLFDWAPESNESSSGWGEAAGDALFSMLIGLNLVDPITPANSKELHFIGHSFGSAVTSEAVERIAASGITVDHVTYLDPHDFDETFIPVDGPQELFTLGQPQIAGDAGLSYGATVWEGVTFADAYYQTTINLGIPDGRPISGAYNETMDFGLFPYNQHSAIWADFYAGTVPSASGSTNGYAYSRIADGQASRPAQTFFAGQDHKWTSDSLVTGSNIPNLTGLAALGFTGANAAQDFEEYKWIPQWNDLTLINGDFDAPGDFDSVFSSSNLIPGWSHHGGRGTGEISKLSGDDDFALRLKPSATSRTHNTFYLAPGVQHLTFDLQRETSSPNDTLRVRLTEALTEATTDLGTPIALSAIDSSFVQQTLDVSSVASGLYTLTFEVLDGGDGVEASVLIDEVQFHVIGSGVTANVTSTDVNGNGNPNRSGIRELTFNFDQPVTVASATSLNLSSQTTGQNIDLSVATLSGNGTSALTWNLLGVSLPDENHTAELPATATTPNLTQTHTIQFSKLSGDVSGDGVVSFSDYTTVQADFGASFVANNNEFRPGDANGDGVVSFSDYTAVQANFGSAVNIPEQVGESPESVGMPVALTNDGARHLTTGNTLILGTLEGTETDAHSSANGNTDDLVGVDDDFGLTPGVDQIGKADSTVEKLSVVTTETITLLDAVITDTPDSVSSATNSAGDDAQHAVKSHEVFPRGADTKGKPTASIDVDGTSVPNTKIDDQRVNPEVLPPRVAFGNRRQRLLPASSLSSTPVTSVDGTTEPTQFSQFSAVVHPAVGPVRRDVAGGPEKVSSRFLTRQYFRSQDLDTTSVLPAPPDTTTGNGRHKLIATTSGKRLRPVIVWSVMRLP